MSIPEQLIEFGKIVAALLIVIDPLAILPILVGVSARLEPDEARSIIPRIVLGATVLLLFFTITGTWILRIFAVTLSDLRIGGGLLLLIISFNLVINGRVHADREAEYRAAIVPLISPLLIGPGAITAAVVLAAIHGVWTTALAGVVTMLITLLLFSASKFLYRLIGESGSDLISRIMGILIAAIAISYIRTGILDLIRET